MTDKDSLRSAWISCDSVLPRDGVVVDTKIDDASGTRNHTPLKRQGNLWFTPDDKCTSTTDRRTGG